MKFERYFWNILLTLLVIGPALHSSRLLESLVTVAGMLFTVGLGLAVGVVFHELGHIAGALVTNSRLFEVSLGSNPRLTFRIAGVLYKLSWLPLGGYVVTVPRTPRWHRLRQFIVLAGGPVFSLLYIWLLLRVGPRADVAAHMALYHQFFQSAQNAFLLLALIEIGRLPGTLWPQKVWVNGREVGNDALQMWRLIRDPAPKPETLDLQLILTEAVYLTQAGDDDAARQWLRRISDRHFAALSVSDRFGWAVYLFGFEEWGMASSLSSDVISELGDECTELRRDAADTYASAVLFGGLSGEYEKAIALLRKTLPAFPDAITLKGTLGSLLVETGDEANGTAILREVFEHSKADIDRAISAAYLSKSTAKTGDTEKARELESIARSCESHRKFIERVVS